MKKEFTVKLDGGEELELYVKTPTIVEIDKADRAKNVFMAQLIKQKDPTLLCDYQVNDYLKEIGVWTEKESKELSELSEKVNDNITKLAKGGLSVNDGRKICIDIADCRMKMVKLLEKRSKFDNLTIESQSDRHKMQNLIYLCTFKADDGSQYWPDFDSYINDENTAVKYHAELYLSSMLYGDEDFEKNLPENRWLKKYGFINDDMRFIDRKTKKFVDRDGNEIGEDLEQKIQKMISFNDNLESDAPFIDEDGNAITFQVEAQVESEQEVEVS